MFDKLAITYFIIWQILNDFILVNTLAVLLSHKQVISRLEHLLIREKIKLTVTVRCNYREAKVSPIFA